jgi:RimJ/RimL family protein N-acetyltransferase
LAVSQRIHLVQLSYPALQALARGDLATANRLTSMALGSCFVSPHWRHTWRRRATQVEEDPSSAGWITRVIVDAGSNAAVGRAGFHGPPDTAGMVEVGYAVDPAFRRMGYARAALNALLIWAKTESSVRTVRASISPDNSPSLALVGQFGFARVGEQWDDEDGLEIVFEIDIGLARSTAARGGGAASA